MESEKLCRPILNAFILVNVNVMTPQHANVLHYWLNITAAQIITVY